MIEDLPIYISLIFGLTTIATLMLFIWTIRNSKTEETRKRARTISIGLIIWLIIQAVLTLKNIYNWGTNSFPPKVVLIGVLPAILIILLLFLTKKGREFIDSLPLKNLTYLNVVRILVEIVLFWLFLNKAIPELMTFAGRNFDILSGITAPFVAYFGLTKGKLNRRTILIWNFMCLGLLINIVVNALLSAPSPVQKFAFEQPNIAISNFPFSWLPTFVVPIVLFGHLVSIRQLIKQKTNRQTNEIETTNGSLPLRQHLERNSSNSPDNNNLSMEMIATKKVSRNDIEQLQQISEQTFFETFSAVNTEENMKKYLNEDLSLEQLTTELNNPNAEFYFATLNTVVIGYLKVNFGHSQTELQDDKAVEIERIYVLREFHGKKVGQVLYEKAMEVAQQKNADYVWLGVWEENPRALAFYKKNGFVEFDKHIFRLGNDEQTDIMMKLQLKGK